MYVPENYSNYKYLVSYSDNFVVLTNRSSVTADFQSPANIPVLIQYHSPSTFYITNTQTFNTSRQFTLVSVSSSFYDRADCPQIICSSFCVGLFIIFIINGLTRLVKKGGIFFGT